MNGRNDDMQAKKMEPWSFTVEFDEEKARKNGYDLNVLYDYVGKNVEKYGNERTARGTWRATAGNSGNGVITAQSLAISKLSRLEWVMRNIKSLTFCEDDDEVCDGIEMLRRVCPERVFD